MNARKLRGASRPCLPAVQAFVHGCGGWSRRLRYVGPRCEQRHNDGTASPGSLAPQRISGALGIGDPRRVSR